MKACYFVEKDLLEWMIENLANLDVTTLDCMGRNSLDILKSNLNLRDDITMNDEKLQKIVTLIQQKMQNNAPEQLPTPPNVPVQQNDEQNDNQPAQQNTGGDAMDTENV